MEFIYIVVGMLVAILLISAAASYEPDEDDCNHEFGSWYEYSVLTQQRECELCGYIQKTEKGKK